jgi:hypothetical protein
MLALLAIVAVQIACAVHVLRNGRPLWWLLIILLFPLVGCLIYAIVEILPGMAGNRRVRVAKEAAVRRIDPEREVRVARDALDTADTAANRTRLGDALAEQENWSEAAVHYLLALDKAPFGNDSIKLKYARACFEVGNAAEALKVLDELPQGRPGVDSDRASMLRGRVLAELGEAEAAIAIFRDLGARMPGGEAQCREAGLLIEQGREAEALVPLAEVERRARRLDPHEKMSHRDMYGWAERTLADLRAKGA